MGTRTPFREILIKTKEPMEKGYLYILHHGAMNPIKLIPLLRLMQSPKTQQDACYFYNRMEGTNARWISYHFKDESEVLKPDNNLMDIFELLNPNLEKEKTKTVIKKKSEISLESEDRYIKEIFHKWNTPVWNRDLFYELDPKIRDIDPSNIWLKTNVKWSFNYYCYKNIFVWIEPQIKSLSVSYFTGDEWEKKKLVDSEGIKKVIPFLKKSYELIKHKYKK